MLFGDNDSATAGRVQYVHSETSMRLNTNGSERMRIDSSGNVGIGTTSPDGRLHVANFQSTKQLTLERTGSNSAKFSINTFTDSMTIVDEGGGSGAERMRIDSSGKVGIGTNSPDTLLNLAGDETAVIRLENSNGSASDGDVIGALQFYKADGSGAGAGVVGQMKMLTQGVGSGGHLTLSTGDTNGNDVERLRISSNGNVGIGTTSPNNKLEVIETSAGAETTPLQLRNSNTTAGTATNLRFVNSTVANSTGAGVAEITNVRTDSPAAGATALTFTTSSGTGLAERVRIDGSGNVGIGTSSVQSGTKVAIHDGATSVASSSGRTLQVASDTTPSIGLYLSGSPSTGDTVGNFDFIANNSDGDQFEWTAARIDSYLVSAAAGVRRAGMRFYTSTSNGQTLERMRIDNTGNVGIGTTSPAAKFHVAQGSGANTVARFENTAQATSLVQFQDTSTSTKPRVGSVGDNLILDTANTERVRITNAGNVGIGTSSPSRKLTIYESSGNAVLQLANNISGVGSQDGFLAYTDGTNVGLENKENGYLSLATNATEQARIDSSGNVGIGTTSPNAKLDVAGQVRIAENGLSQQHLKLVDSNATSKFGQIGFDNGILRIDSFNTGANGTIQFYRSTTGFGAESARFDASGNFLVGKTSADNTTEGTRIDGNGLISSVADGDAALLLNRLTSDGTIALFRKDSTTVGTISVTGSATTYNTSSDARLKDITGSARGLAVINELNPVAYDWKADGKSDEGLIAQEVKELVPNAVSENEDGYYQMDYSKLVTPLIKAIQEQQEQIEELKQQLEELKN